MAEVIHVFAEPAYVNGVAYRVQVTGRPQGHLWEGWIEFAAHDGSDVRRTGRETTQPDREALAYWAAGLSGVYIEGALDRALPVPRREPVVSEALFGGPDPNRAAVGADGVVLDPFSVAERGEQRLRRELKALRARDLRNIVRAYDLGDDSIDLERLSEPELVELIVEAVEPVV